jgi:predicted metal-binding membrane protein
MTALRTLGWRYPEWWCVAASGAGWLVLAAIAGGREHFSASMSALESGIRWTLMVVAMMVPLVLGPLRFTAERSLWRRRHRAVAVFLAGFVSLWLLAGILLHLVIELLRADGGTPPPLAAGGLLLAAAWQYTPAKRRALMACHRTRPLAPHGWRAHFDCLHYGCTVGVHCAVACWALMLSCALLGHSVLVMASVTAIALVERYSTRRF